VKLFIIRRGKHGDPVRTDDRTILTFETKAEAKRIRDTLGEPFVVSYGPDHKLYKGN
jgi:hypothetical protein